MIRRMLIYAAGLLLVWCVLCQIALSNGWRTSAAATPRAANLVAAERLATLDRMPRVLMVGSSLTTRLAAGPQNAEDFYALGLSGHSAITSLEILLGTLDHDPTNKPDIVVVETNIITGAEDDLGQYVVSSPMFYVRRYVAGLRYEYQPLNCLFSLLRWAGGKKAVDSGHLATDPDAIKSAQAKAIELAKTQHSSLDAISRLRALVNEVKRRGIAVAFVRIPTSSIILDSPAQKDLLKTTREAFSSDQFIVFDETMPIRLDDGFHLSQASGCDVRDQLLARLHATFPEKKIPGPLTCGT